MRYCQRIAFYRMAAMVAATSLSFKQLGSETQWGVEVLTNLRDAMLQMPGGEGQDARQP